MLFISLKFIREHVLAITSKFYTSKSKWETSLLLHGQYVEVEGIRQCVYVCKQVRQLVSRVSKAREIVCNLKSLTSTLLLSLRYAGHSIFWSTNFSNFLQMLQTCHKVRYTSATQKKIFYSPLSAFKYS